MMSSYQDRRDLIDFVLFDAAADVKFLESAGLIFKWYRYESALRKANKYRLLAAKRGKPLEEEIEILLFRRNLNDTEG